MSSRSERTTIILLASLHLDYDRAPAFIAEYREVLRELAPSVICAELSPEQLSGRATCRSKPEYEAVVLPVARELGAQVVSIQMPTEAALAWQHRMLAAGDQLSG